MVSVKQCPGHNDNHTQEGGHKVPPSVRDSAHLMCAGAWDVIKIKEKGNVGKKSHFNSLGFKANRTVWVVFLLM